MEDPHIVDEGVWVLKKASPIIYGTIFLTAANLLLRLAAMTFQIYFSRRAGAAGTGLLQLIFSVTALSFTIGAAGIRTCAMYLTAGELGRNRPQRVPTVLSGCFQYSFVCGGLAALALWCSAPWLAGNWIGDVAAAHALRLYALFLPVRCLDGVLTGYFTSAGRIKTMVAVQFGEQCCAMAVSFFLLECWAGADVGRACLSVIAGNCLALLLSFCILLLLAPNHKGGKCRPPYQHILHTALPVALADTLRGGLNTAEHLIIPKRLALFAGTVDALADYGVLHGMVFPVLMFPAAVLFSLAELLVPEFSRCAAGERWPRVRYLVRRGLRVGLLYGLCTGGLLFLWAIPLGEVLYHTPAAGEMLRLYAPFVPVLYLDHIVDAMCKGLGQQSANARYNALTSFLDVVFLWLLLPRWGLGGYYFSFAATHLINFGLSLRRLALASGLRVRR